jgi:hypothetical protein
MQPFLHLVIVDTNCRAALVTRFGQRWMWPVLAVDERVRSGPVIADWLLARGLRGEPLGQWLGRLSAAQNALDWLIIVRVAKDVLTVSSGLCPMPTEELVGATALIEYQGWASERAGLPHGIPSVPGPFGDLRWFADVARWVAAAVGSATVSSSLDVVWHRLGAYEVVLEWRDANRRWFFKGLDRDRAAEANVTGAMSRLLPDSFARTVALESRPGGSVWWLMEACPGVSLAERFSSEGARSVARAYADVQQRARAVVLRADGIEMPSLELESLAGWVRSMFESAAAPETVDAVSSAVATACANVSRVDVPASWLAPDLDPTNVVLDGDNVRFIDLDDAMVGPAPLGMATFVRRCESALRSDPRHGDGGASLLDAYGLAWEPNLSLTRAEWKAMALVSQALESRLAWQRVEAKTRRGEVYRCLESARAAIRRGLTKAVETCGGIDGLI